MKFRNLAVSLLLLIGPIAGATYPDYNWNNFGHGTSFQISFSQDVTATPVRNSYPLISIPVEREGWLNLNNCFIEIISSAETVTVPAGSTYKAIYNDESGNFDLVIPNHKATLICNARIMVKTVKAGMNKIGMDLDLPLTRDIHIEQNEVLPK